MRAWTAWEMCEGETLVFVSSCPSATLNTLRNCIMLRCSIGAPPQQCQEGGLLS